MLLALFEGNLSVTAGFPAKRASNAELLCFDVTLNKILNKTNGVTSDFRYHDSHVLSL